MVILKIVEFQLIQNSNTIENLVYNYAERREQYKIQIVDPKVKGVIFFNLYWF